MLVVDQFNPRSASHRVNMLKGKSADCSHLVRASREVLALLGFVTHGAATEGRRNGESSQNSGEFGTNPTQLRPQPQMCGSRPVALRRLLPNGRAIAFSAKWQGAVLPRPACFSAGETFQHCLLAEETARRVNKSGRWISEPHATSIKLFAPRDSQMETDAVRF